MKRFILLTFGFLGWAFYEMSGGSDFEPASDRMAKLDPAPVVVKADTAVPAPAVTADASPSIQDTDPPLKDLDEDVTRVSLDLTTLQGAQNEEQPQPAPVIQSPVQSNIDPETGVATNVGTSLSSGDTPAIIPSLILPNDTGATPVETASVDSAATGSDVRTVSGNRVNVRGGPGTDFGVVSRLARGDAVEVIEDNGNGWVLMRPVGGGTEGWMADFLLNAG